MTRPALVALTLTLCAAGPAPAQDANPMTTAITAQFRLISGNITKAAAKMSAADYPFKPTPEVRSFAGLIGHITNANYMICSTVAGEKNPSPGDAEAMDLSKAALAVALEASFGYCEGVLGRMTDAEGQVMVKYFLGEQPKLAVLAFNNAHNMEHYGNIVTYMRMKGLVPPSSER
jgi:uncharacterized damage-inducible protein DinB